MTAGPRIATLALLVRDYDEAIAFYVGKLGFELTGDTPLHDGKRWVTVRPAGRDSATLLLAQAADEAQRAGIGRQGAGRVWLFLETDDFARDHAAFAARGIRFLEEPRSETYGTVAVFEDLYGNLWDLIQPKLEGSHQRLPGTAMERAVSATDGVNERRVAAASRRD